MLPLDFFCIRHGESHGGKELGKFRKDKDSIFSPEFLNCFNGDVPLSNTGKKQARVVGEWLKDWLKEKKLPCFDRHLASTHIRAPETGALLNLPNAEWELDSQLHERDNGLWGSLPDKNWQERFDRNVDLEQIHYFYTRMPGGESIENTCVRLRPFVSDLDREEKNTKRVVVVAHRDVAQALRVIFEGTTPNEFHERWKANLSFFRIGNGQILHYTRVDPFAVGEPKFTHYDRFGWVRSINPWCPEYAGHGWMTIKKRLYSNEELLAMVERFPKLIDD